MTATPAASETSAAPPTSSALPPGVTLPSSGNAPTPPSEPVNWHMPKLLLIIEDMDCPGAERFLEYVRNPTAFLKTCIVAIYELLFTKKSAPTHVRSITFNFRSMDGVAYTTGSRLDNDHKEIHFNTNYIASISPDRIEQEIKGVLQHELVHCFQCDGKGTCPGGLVEGMADYVRLRRGFSPPHWRRVPGGRWDSGYERTAYFLDWINSQCGETCVRKINESMMEKYDEHCWKTITGHSLEDLWERYKGTLE